MTSSASAPIRWNRLALVSFLCSLAFPLGGVIAQLSGGLVHPSYISTPPTYDVGLTLLFASFLTAPTAILTGHSAMNGAKRGVYRHPLRGLAFMGLILGYGAFVAFFVGVFVLYWLLTHIRMHIVF